MNVKESPPLATVCVGNWLLEIPCSISFQQPMAASLGYIGYILKDFFSKFHLFAVITVRRYASAVLAVVVCPSVRHTRVLYQNG